jgi:hypothetical protein
VNGNDKGIKRKPAGRCSDPARAALADLGKEVILCADVGIQNPFRVRSSRKGTLDRALARQEIPLIQGMKEPALPISGPWLPFTLLFIRHADARLSIAVLMKPVRLFKGSKNSASA